jgi:hypothetical protein
MTLPCQKGFWNMHEMLRGRWTVLP